MLVHAPQEGRASRGDPGHYTVPDLPAEFVAFERPVDGLGVGQPGKVGLLELTFTPVAGATRVTRHFQHFPLQVFRPVYLDPDRADMAFVYVMSHGGTLQGDRARIDIRCDPGAAAHITTQSAAKIYRMDQNYATQLVTLTAEEESILEYLPEPAIPFRGSRFFQHARLVFHSTATVIIGEMLLPGRAAYGERHDYDVYASRLDARSSTGELCFADTLHFSSRTKPLLSPGRLGGYEVLATLYAVSRRIPGHVIADRLHRRIAMMADVVGGVSELPNACGAWVRLLGPNSSVVRAALHAAWDEARRALLGASAPNRRKT